MKLNKKGSVIFPSQVDLKYDVTMTSLWRNLFFLKKVGHVIYRWKALNERIENRIRSVVSKWRHKKLFDYLWCHVTIFNGLYLLMTSFAAHISYVILNPLVQSFPTVYIMTYFFEIKKNRHSDVIVTSYLRSTWDGKMADPFLFNFNRRKGEWW